MILVYYRVSTQSQDFDSQKIEVDRYLNSIGNPPHKEYKDVMSGKDKERPQYQQLIEAAKEGDDIVVYKLDRFSRNASQAIITLIELDERGVGFISITQNILNLTKSNPFRRTFLALFSELAEMERQVILERTAHGRKAAMEKGVKFGPKIKSKDPELIIQLRSEGLTYKEIAEMCNLSYGTVHKVVNG